MNSVTTAAATKGEDTAAIIEMGLEVHADITADDEESYPGVTELLPVVKQFGIAAVLQMLADAAHGAADAHTIGEGAGALRVARLLEKAIKELQ